MQQPGFTVLGLMSGSSLDGLDAAVCRFYFENEGEQIRVVDWEFLGGQTYPYEAAWQATLRRLPDLAGSELALVDVRLADLWAEMIRDLLNEQQPDLIASHGHTVLHWPEKQLSLQIGSGAVLAVHLQTPVACDFRTADIALGGEGTPLAPLADAMLFSEFPYCLNIGGIANISYTGGDRIVAFDVGPANQIFNELASQVGKPYDAEGRLAASGNLDEDLLASVNRLSFFEQSFPRSLDNGWIRREVWPLYERSTASIPDKLHTAGVQLASQVARSVQLIHGENTARATGGKILITGGGAYNAFLVRQLEKALHPWKIRCVLPERSIIDFKEAILMGLMGALRWYGYPNCLASVTGAERDSIGGAIYLS